MRPVAAEAAICDREWLRQHHARAAVVVFQSGFGGSPATSAAVAAGTTAVPGLLRLRVGPWGAEDWSGTVGGGLRGA